MELARYARVCAHFLYNITDDEPQWLHQDALDQNIVSAICAVYDNQDFRILVADPKGGKLILRTLLLEVGGWLARRPPFARPLLRTSYRPVPARFAS